MRALRLHGSATFFFFFNDTATTEIYTLSLHDALPICALPDEVVQLVHEQDHVRVGRQLAHQAPDPLLVLPAERRDRKSTRLNSSHLVISYAVFCLKKKKTITSTIR